MSLLCLWERHEWRFVFLSPHSLWDEVDLFNHPWLVFNPWVLMLINKLQKQTACVSTLSHICSTLASVYLVVLQLWLNISFHIYILLILLLQPLLWLTSSPLTLLEKRRQTFAADLKVPQMSPPHRMWKQYCLINDSLISDTFSSAYLESHLVRIAFVALHICCFTHLSPFTNTLFTGKWPFRYIKYYSL